MNFRTTYILFAAVLAAVGVFALTQYFRVKPSSLSNYVLPSLHADTKNPANPDNFDSIEIDRRRPKEERLVFLKRDNGWEMDKPYTLHVDANQVSSLIRQVVDARRESQSDVVKNLKYYELDQPATVVILKKGADQEWRLNIGTQGPGSGASGVVYVTSSDRPDEPLVVRRAELDSVFKGVNDFRSKDLLEASAFNTSYVNLQEPQKEPVILDKGSDGTWRFEKPPFGEAALRGEGTPGLGTTPGQPKRITGVQDLLEAIGAIKVESNADFGPPDASDADLAKFGLEKGKPAYLRIEIKRTAGLLGTGGEPKPAIQDALLVGNPVGEGDKKPDDKGEKKAGDTTPKRYVRLESERAVSKVAAKNFEGIATVAANPSVLRNRDLVTIAKADVDAIDIQNAAGQFKIRGKVGRPTITKQHVKLFVGSGKPRNADDGAVQGLLDTLTKERLIKDFPDPAKEAEMGFDKPRAVVSLWVNGIKEEEKKPEEKKDEKAEDKKDKPEEKKDADAEPPLRDDKPAVKLTFGKEDKDGVYVRREVGDKKLLAVVPATVLAKVSEGPLAYQDKNLPSFSESADVEDLVLERGGEVFEAGKEKKDDQSPPVWKLKKPESLAGRNADPAQVQRVLDTLRSLRPIKLVAEGPADLDKYGLKTPQVKATVKVKAGDKTDDWVYLFGTEADDKSGVYAKQEKHDLVFVVPEDTLTTLRGELQDPTIFRFESAKVKEIKVTGWKQQQGFLITLDLERKGPNEWTVKAPPGFDLDNGQADKFIQRLSHLRAERFVVRQKGPQPEHKLGAQEAALHIEITVEGEKAPLTLTIGALDTKEKAYYAQASTVPGDVFLVSQANFEQVLSGPKYFSKKTEGGSK